MQRARRERGEQGNSLDGRIKDNSTGLDSPRFSSGGRSMDAPAKSGLV